MAVTDIETREVRGILLEMGASISFKYTKIPEAQIALHIERTRLQYLLDLMVRAGLLIKDLIGGFNHYAINLNHYDDVVAIIRSKARLTVGKDGKPRIEKIDEELQK